MIDLSSKVAIITGGASGIGRATATLLHTLGARVAVVDRDVVGGQWVCSQMLSDLDRSKFFEADAADEREISLCVERVLDHFGPPDILVNAAATYIMEGVEASRERWLESFSANTIAYALWTRKMVEVLPQGRRAAVVNVSSISAHIAQRRFATYSASKAAVGAMTRCFALDLAPLIRVNSVAPGTIWSESNARFIKEHFGFDRAQADAHPEIGGRHVLGRCGEPEEVAYAIAFLCSDSASFITGTEMLVDGGYLLQ